MDATVFINEFYLGELSVLNLIAGFITSNNPQSGKLVNKVAGLSLQYFQTPPSSYTGLPFVVWQFTFEQICWQRGPPD
jgi:hypothetical protein